MKHLFFNLFFLIAIFSANAQKSPDANTILDKVDQNMTAKSQIITAKMEIGTARTTRTMEMKTWTVGDKKSFTEYLAPAREKGTKMLKMNNQLCLGLLLLNRCLSVIDSSILSKKEMGNVYLSPLSNEGAMLHYQIDF